jgi:ketosteroid isomerase-like protein
MHGPTANEAYMHRSTVTGVLLALMASPALADPAEDIAAVAALDTAYQAAVERNDAAAMAAILHEDMILVFGNGVVYTREDLLRDARMRSVVYEHQVEDEGTQSVRLYGDSTAIVTARLYIKGVNEGAPIEFRLWFSDTYVRTPAGWRYVFGQASMALPDQQ